MNKKLKRLILVSVLMACSWNGISAKTAKGTTEKFDWNPVMEAIIQVESSGNKHAKSGNQVGAMQITPIMVADCNAILKQKGSKKRFRLADRFSVTKSKEMFLLIQEWYNPENDIEKAIRSWNGGPTYTMGSTQRYYERVMSYLD